MGTCLKIWNTMQHCTPISADSEEAIIFLASRLICKYKLKQLQMEHGAIFHLSLSNPHLFEVCRVMFPPVVQSLVQSERNTEQSCDIPHRCSHSACPWGPVWWRCSRHQEMGGLCVDTAAPLTGSPHRVLWWPSPASDLSGTPQIYTWLWLYCLNNHTNDERFNQSLFVSKLVSDTVLRKKISIYDVSSHNPQNYNIFVMKGLLHVQCYENKI